MPALISEGRLTSREDDAGHLSMFAKAELGGRPGDGGGLALGAVLRGVDRADPFEDRRPLTASGTTRVAWGGGEVALTGVTDLGESTGAEAWIGWAGGRPGGADRLETGAVDTYLVRRMGHDGVQGGASVRHRMSDDSWLGRGAVSLMADGSWDHLRTPTWRAVARSSAAGRRAGDGQDLQPARSERLSNAGVAAEWALMPHRRLDLTLGGRVDRHSVYGAEPTWRGAVVVDPGGGVTLKLLVGASFLAPSPELLFGATSGPGDIVGNRRLRPQRASQVEVAAGWRPTPGVVLDVTAYVGRVDDLVVLQRQGLNLMARNGASLETQGAEAEASIRRGPAVIRAGLAYARAMRAADAGSPEPLLSGARPAQQFPRWSGAFGASWHAAGWGLPLALHVDGRWSGARPSSDSNALIAEAPYDLSPFVLTDVAVSTEGWRPMDGREAVLRVEVSDLWDEAPADPGVGGVDLPSLGRRIALTLEQRF